MSNRRAREYPGRKPNICMPISALLSTNLDVPPASWVEPLTTYSPYMSSPARSPYPNNIEYNRDYVLQD